MSFYRSPLHIIPDEVIKNFTSSDQLKQVRKEVMLEFELAGTTTIDIGGTAYDKSTILHAFEQLEYHFDYHLQLYKDKVLLRFIENGDVSLFYEQRTWEDIGTADFRDWLGPVFQYRLQKVIHKCVQVKGYHSIRKLRAIHTAKVKIPNTLAFQAYAKAHEELSYIVLETEKILAFPFQENKGLRLKENIGEYINYHYLSVFKWLPFQFERLKQKYTIAAHNFIACVFGKNRYFRSYRVEELKLLKIGAEISATFRPDLKAGSLARQLESEIDSRKSSSVNWGETSIVRPIFVIIGLIIFWAIVNNVINRPAPPRPYPNITTTNYTDRIIQSSAVLSAKVTGTCWMSLSVTNKKQIHFFAFHNDSIGEYAIFVPLGKPSDYASLSIPFTWTISGWDKKKKLILNYTAEPNIQIGGANQLSQEQQQLFDRVEDELTSGTKIIPIYFQFPEDLIFYDDFFGIANSLRFKKMKASSWSTFADVPSGDHTFIDQQIEAISALNYLKACRSNSRKGNFHLFINPETLVANFKRDSNRSPLGSLSKQKGQWILTPYKWTTKEAAPAKFYVDYKNLRYMNQNNQLKTGDIRVYVKSFAADTCQVIAL
jgi:hypothetical protein